MEVVNSDQKYKVFWMYNSSYLSETLFMAKGGFQGEYLTMPYKKQLELAGIDVYDDDKPECDVTHCFLVNERNRLWRTNL